jgi:hypothetical protein
LNILINRFTIKVILAAASLLCLLFGCTSPTEIGPISTDDISVGPGYPIFVVEKNNDAAGYPLPEFSPGVAPGFTPNPSFGIVHGQLLRNNVPVVGYNLYLADLLIDEEGVERVVSLKRAVSPQAILDKEGKFVFNEVPPNRYALMFADGVSAYLLLVPESEIEEAIIVDVQANDLIDLGILNYSDFPLDY